MLRCEPYGDAEAASMWGAERLQRGAGDGYTDSQQKKEKPAV